MIKYRWFFNVPKEEQTLMNEFYGDGTNFEALRYSSSLYGVEYKELRVYLPSGSHTCENIIIAEWEE